MGPDLASPASINPAHGGARWQTARQGRQQQAALQQRSSLQCWGACLLAARATPSIASCLSENFACKRIISIACRMCSMRSVPGSSMSLRKTHRSSGSSATATQRRRRQGGHQRAADPPVVRAAGLRLCHPQSSSRIRLRHPRCLLQRPRQCLRVCRRCHRARPQAAVWEAARRRQLSACCQR